MERGEVSISYNTPAGKPSSFERKPIGERSRSRRGSVSEDSQLSVENFGGSRDNLHLLGRNPDKEMVVASGKITGKITSSDNSERKINNDSVTSEVPKYAKNEQNFQMMMEDNPRHSIPDRYDDNSRSESRLSETAETLLKVKEQLLDNRYAEQLNSERSNRTTSPQNGKPFFIIQGDSNPNNDGDNGKSTSFAQLSKLKEQLGGGMNIVYMHQDNDADISAQRKTSADKNQQDKKYQQEIKSTQHSKLQDGEYD